MENIKVVRLTIDLLIDKANTQFDFDVARYSIDDYLDEGYLIQDMVDKYNTAYQQWYTRSRIKDMN